MNGNLFDVSSQHYQDFRSFFLHILMLRCSRELITEEKIKSMAITIENLKTWHDSMNKLIWKELLHPYYLMTTTIIFLDSNHHFRRDRIRQTRRKIGSSKVILSWVQMQKICVNHAVKKLLFIFRSIRDHINLTLLILKQVMCTCKNQTKMNDNLNRRENHVSRLLPKRTNIFFFQQLFLGTTHHPQM